MPPKTADDAPPEKGFRYRWHPEHAPVFFESIRVQGLSDQEHRLRESGVGVRVEPGEEFTSETHVNHPIALPLSPAAQKAAAELEREFVSGAE